MDKNKVLCLKSSGLDFLTVIKIKYYMLFKKDYKLAFDMRFVKNIRENFLQFIKKCSQKNKISLFNLNSEIMALMNIRNYNKYVYIYTDESDFCQNTRAIVNRQFRVF